MADQVRLLRHSIRGKLNALKLGTEAVALGLTPPEALEFLGYIIDACDGLNTDLDAYEALGDDVIAASQSSSVTAHDPAHGQQ